MASVEKGKAKWETVSCHREESLPVSDPREASWQPGGSAVLRWWAGDLFVGKPGIFKKFLAD